MVLDQGTSLNRRTPYTGTLGLEPRISRLTAERYNQLS